jgi:hypothetical protein
MSACAICRRDVTGNPAAVYSKHENVYYCPPSEWTECAQVAEAQYQKHAQAGARKKDAE